jgi:hypothetical protein
MVSRVTPNPPSGHCHPRRTLGVRGEALARRSSAILHEREGNRSLSRKICATGSSRRVLLNALQMLLLAER